MCKRLAALFVLSGLVFVAAGLAAPKKLNINPNRSGDWSDLSLQNGSLADLGSGLSSGGGNLALSQSRGSISPLILAPDNWNGGPGNWGNSSNWSAGEPGASSNVTIYSGGTDLVALDTGSTTIHSLQLGGVANGYYSELTDVGTNQTLNINGALNVGANGEINFSGSMSVINAGADSTNAGQIYLSGGSSLNISGNFNNSGITYAENAGSLINITGDLTNTGQFYEYAGGTATIGGNVTNSYYFQVGGGTTVNIGGNVNNSYVMTTDGGNLNITGTLTNSGNFELEAAGDTASVTSLVNTGLVFVAAGASLNLTNQPDGITDVVSGTNYSISGSFTAGSNNAFYQLNSVEGQLYLYGQSFTVTPGSGTLTNSGYLDFGSGSNVTIAGNVSNSGFLSTGYYGAGGNTLNITGTLTNNIQFYVYGTGDVANVGSLINNDQTYIGSGATLNLTNQAAGVTDVAAGTQYDIYGTFTAGSNNALYNLTSVEGALYLANGQTTGITPNGGTLTNSGTLALYDGSTLNITGNVANSSGGFLSTGYYGAAGNTLNISGNLTNNGGSIYIYGNGDVANVGSLTNNSGVTYIFSGGTLNLENQSGGLTDVGLGSTFYVYGNFNDVAGGGNGFAHLNSLEGVVYLFGQNFTDTPGSGTLTISSDGQLTANYNPTTLLGTTLTIAGNVNNSGVVATGYQSAGASGNTLTVAGNLTNNSGSDFFVYSAGDAANVGSLANSGYTYVGPGATLNLTNQPNGITDALSGSLFQLYGTFNAGGGNGFANLTNVEGTVELFGQNFTMTPSGGTLIIASGAELTANYNPYTSVGTTLTISDDVNNSGFLATGYNNGGTGNTLNITGNLTNNRGSEFYVYSSGDVANVATLTNGGYTYVAPGATLNLTNQAGGITDALAGSTFSLYGSFNDQVNHASGFANLTSVEGAVNLYDQNLAITPNGGTLTVSSGGSLTANGYNSSSALTINGGVSNGGTLTTGYNGGTANTLTITGNLTTSGLLDFYGVGDTAQVNGNLQNSGVVELLNTNQTLNIGGNLTNAGSGAIYEYYGGQNINVSGTVDNSGLLYQTNSGGGGNALTVTGLTTNEAGGQIELTGAGIVLAANGGLTNLGTVTVSNGAAIDPPFLHNGGTITIDGTSSMLVGTGSPGGQGYTQVANGTLGEIIASASNFGVINVTGAVSLAGTLDIMLQGGYDPSNGSQFKFLNFTANELTGSFSTVENTTFNGGTQMWVLNYNPMLGFVELTAEPVSASATFWLGGTGNWSINADWSNGTPTVALDATIYSGVANDLVTLDQGTEFAKSLTIGGAPNTYTSELTDAGQSAQNLTITSGLTIGQTGTLSLVSGSTVTAGADSTNAGTISLLNGSMLAITGNLDNSGVLSAGILFGGSGGNTITIKGTLTNQASGQFALYSPGDVGNVGTLNNSGAVFIGAGATLNLTNQMGGITDVVAGSRFDVLGNFNDVLGGTSAFANLTSVEGLVETANGQTTNITPIGGVLTIGPRVPLTNDGIFDVAAGSTVNINGNVNNSGDLATNDSGYGGGNTLTINGNLTNALSGNVTVYGPGDLLKVNGNLDNAGQLTLWFGPTTAATITVNGMLTNEATGQINLYGTGETLQVNGNLDNLGQLVTNEFGSGGSNTITITGTLTNSGTFQLNGPGDMATLGSLTNNAGGILDVENASTLTINGNVDNFGALETSAFSGTGGNTLNIGGALTNEAGADFILYNHDTANISTGMTNNGFVDLENGSTLNITGDVTNNNQIYTGHNGLSAPGNQINITGSLTNNGTFFLQGTQDSVNVTGDMTNTSGGEFELVGANLTAKIGGSVNNSGFVDVEGGSSLTIAGDVTNNGGFETSNYGSGNNTLTVDGTFTNQNGDVLALKGPGDVANIGMLVNDGFLTVATGATLNLTNQPNGITDAEGYVQLFGTFTAGGNPGFAHLNSVDGTLLLYGQNFTITPGSGTLTIGYFGRLDADFNYNNFTPSSIIINGDVQNSGALNTGFDDMYGGNSLDITGNLTNETTSIWGFSLFGFQDVATVGGSLTNSGVVQVSGIHSQLTVNGDLTNNAGGFIDVENHSTLNIAGDVTNSATGSGFGIYTSFNGNGGNTINIGGTLTNSGNFQLLGPGDNATIGSVTNNAGGFIDVEGGSTLSVTGNVTNSAGGRDGIYTSFNGTGNNTIDIGGTLTSNGNFELLGRGDMASIGNGMRNSGVVDLENGSTLTITGDVTNSGDILTSLDATGGNTLTIAGTLSNSGEFQLLGPVDVATVGSLTNNAAGFVDVYGGSTLTITGEVVNAGTIGLLNGVANISGNLDNLITGEIYLENGSTLNVAGNFDTRGFLESYGGSGNIVNLAGGTGTLTIEPAGLIDVENGSALTINGNITNASAGVDRGIITGFNGTGGNRLDITGAVTNNGNFQLLGSGDSASIGGGLTNAGTVDVEGGSTLAITGDVTNSGTLETNANSPGGNNTITLNGLLTNTPTGIITLNGSMDMLQALAGIVNSGTINVNNSSTVDPPFFNNLGTVNIDSTSTFIVGTGHASGPGYIQLANGTLGEMINSTAFGVINVNGSALLNGTLDILLQGGYDPSVGSSYKFLLTNANGINGVFRNIENDIFNGGTEKWGVIYDSADGFVELIAETNSTPVPEPGTLLVLIPALLGAGFGLRRQLFR
jgi:hypothetical protein